MTTEEEEREGRECKDERKTSNNKKSAHPRSKNTGRFRQESTGNRRNVEAVFPPEIFWIFSDDFRPVPAGSGDFPASFLQDHLIDLLLSKAARNYQSHRFMDDFVYDVMHHRSNENDLIKHIQDTASTKILIDEQELLILKNLTHANIEYKRAEYRK
jgi:hypothetical protein